jgi:quercetin dioxygenase-like cupin family protein
MIQQENAALKAPAGWVTIKARGSETGGALTACESAVEPGEGPPLHLHVREDELMYVLEGRLRVELDGVMRDAPAGAVIFIPRGVAHTWQNAGAGLARLFFLFTPAAEAMERFFERSDEFSAELSAAERFQRFAGDAGMEVLGPPLAAQPA